MCDPHDRRNYTACPCVHTFRTSGSGLVEVFSGEVRGDSHPFKCPVCDGTGKLPWPKGKPNEH